MQYYSIQYYSILIVLQYLNSKSCSIVTTASIFALKNLTKRTYFLILMRLVNVGVIATLRS